MSPASTLKPGSVVRMRERLWRVNYVDGDVFGATALDGRDNLPRRFHRDLEVVERGDMPLPSPEALGELTTQDLLLQAQRFALLHGTAPILGLQRSRAIPTDFQLVPLHMILGRRRVRLGIFDDVGTGKTIEAGLVLSELIARGKARRILIVVPANLREQWRDALDHFFHIQATLVSGTLLPALERRLLPGQSVWGSHDVVIASIDYLKTRTAQVLSYPWDLVVIDEAHMCAQPHVSASMGRSKPEMARWQFAEAIADHANHLLLLTATPHNGYTDSYSSLFRMLDATLVVESDDGPRILRDKARKDFIVQRRRADIEGWYEQRGTISPFPTREADEYPVSLDRFPAMADLLDRLRDYATVLYENAQSTVDQWIAAHLQKRALSSPAALQQSIRNRSRTLERRASTESTKKDAVAAEEATSDQLFSEDDEGDAANLDQTASSLDAQNELQLLAEVAEAAGKVTPAKDPKLQELIRLIPKRLDRHPDARRIMVFTKYKDTLDYLVKELTKSGKAKRSPLPLGLQVFAIHGAMNLAQRRETFDGFEQAEQAVLVATDCISEGLNLQRACAEIVHYELPWNPNRLEQRNGRIDRFQQREKVVGISTLVLDDPLDAALLYLIDKKANEIRRAYGFVPPFLANTDILLHLTNPGAAYQQLLREKAPGGHQGNFFDEGQDARQRLEELDPKLARLAEEGLSGDERINRIAEESFYGQSDVTLAAVEDALARSRDVIGSPENVATFILTSIRNVGGQVAADGDGTFTLTVVPPDLVDVAQVGGRITFDPLLGMDDPNVDVIDLAHPLARRLIDLTIERSQLPECEGRVAMKISPHAEGITAVLHVLFRYVAHGEPPVLMEEVAPIAWRVSTGEPVDPFPLITTPPGKGHQAREDIVEQAEEILTDPTLHDYILAVAQQRAAELAKRHADLSADWAAGLEHVESTSQDVVALTVVYPEVKA